MTRANNRIRDIEFIGHTAALALSPYALFELDFRSWLDVALVGALLLFSGLATLFVQLWGECANAMLKCPTPRVEHRVGGKLEGDGISIFYPKRPCKRP